MTISIRIALQPKARAAANPSGAARMSLCACYLYDVNRLEGTKCLSSEELPGGESVS